MRLACQEHLIPGDDLVAKWEAAWNAGFEAIELHGHGDFAFRDRLDELQAARRAGVAMPTVCVIMGHFIGDFDAAKRRDAIDNMKSLLSVMAAIEGFGAITPASYGMFSSRLPPYKPPRTAQEDDEVLVEGLTELGEHADKEGVVLLLEPLNRYEDHMVNTVARAVALCERTGLESVKVMGDLFHMNIEEDDIPRSIRNAGDRLAHVHLADSNREHPGTGHIDFSAAFAALNDIGFNGCLALECGLRGEPEAVLSEVTGRLKRAMSA